ncbi:MAG: hypothetical protein E7235_00250 [Lachnospiraceae bacterium]|nr:hypothetical protein [Lachnospiraceae bacterium]
MKKIPTLFITLICTIVFAISVYAKPLDSYTISGGIDFSKESESTFDENRVISGTAPCGTKVLITISNSDSVNTEVFEITVGASGIFSKTLRLDNGENQVSVLLSLDGYDTVEKGTVINKKDNKIKHTLKKGICIPGEGISGDIVLFYS